MKIVITASSPDLDATVDLRFGRAFCFIVIDEDGLEWEAFPNPALDARGGAGVQATRFTVREVLSLYQAGQLAGLSSPGNPGHRDR